MHFAKLSLLLARTARRSRVADVRTAAFRRILELLPAADVSPEEAELTLLGAVDEIEAVCKTHATARESSDEKGRRYLIEGRLEIVYVKPSVPEIRALCRGDSAEVYRLGWSPQIEWWCGCPVKTANCSHLAALKLVVTVPNREQTSVGSGAGAPVEGAS